MVGWSVVAGDTSFFTGARRSRVAPPQAVPQAAASGVPARAPGVPLLHGFETAPRVERLPVGVGSTDLVLRVLDLAD